MNPMQWIKLAVEGAKLGLDVYRGLVDRDEAVEKISRIQKRGEINALTDERLRKLAKERAKGKDGRG